jgi:hypothetical protein
MSSKQAEDAIMYLMETSFGEAFKPRSPKPPARPPRKPLVKPLPKVPADRLLEVYVYWDLKVPFRKDLGDFGQEVAKAIARHVATSDKTQSDSLLRGKQKELKMNHDYYSAKAAEPDFVTVRANLRFTKSNHTGLDWLHIEVPPL